MGERVMDDSQSKKVHVKIDSSFGRVRLVSIAVRLYLFHGFDRRRIANRNKKFQFGPNWISKNYVPPVHPFVGQVSLYYGILDYFETIHAREKTGEA